MCIGGIVAITDRGPAGPWSKTIKGIFYNFRSIDFSQGLFEPLVTSVLVHWCRITVMTAVGCAANSIVATTVDCVWPGQSLVHSPDVKVPVIVTYTGYSYSSYCQRAYLRVFYSFGYSHSYSISPVEQLQTSNQMWQSLNRSTLAGTLNCVCRDS